MKKIVVFSRYDRSGASSRYRLYFLQEELNLKYKFTFYPLIDKDLLYEKIVHKSYKNKIFLLIFKYLKRIFQIIKLKKKDIIIIEKELFPYIPTIFFEKILKKKSNNLIVDFDDGIHVNYQKSFLSFFFKYKIEDIIKNANNTIVGSRNLYKWAINYNKKVHLISTMVKSFDYKNLKKYKLFTIIWIGSYSTLNSINELIKNIDSIDYPEKIQVIIIGAKLKIKIKNVNLINPEWSEDNENYYLERSHLGIINLDKDSFSFFKCSHKITKYFSAKLPVLGNNYGENKNLIIHNYNGYLYKSYKEALKYINLLIINKNIYKQISQNVEDYYNKTLINTVLKERYLNIFK